MSCGLRESSDFSNAKSLQALRRMLLFGFASDAKTIQGIDVVSKVMILSQHMLQDIQSLFQHFLP